MSKPFHVTGSNKPRPGSTRTVFCDGSADASFRDGVDLELSHWIPNRTPARYRADTSTEICLRFAADRDRADYDLAVNDHVDVDGILSVFAAAEPERALAHRAVLVGAAEIGDFWAWADEPAQAVFQGVVRGLDGLTSADDKMDVYEAAFRRLQPLLDGDPTRDPEIASGLRAMRESVALLDSGAIAVDVMHEGFVRFEVPRRLAERDLTAALRVPPFNESLASGTLLLPHARARDHGRRIHLVSVAGSRGWYHDLWYPGWCWADTHDRRRPSSLSAESSNLSRLDAPDLAAALRTLACEERAPGDWRLADHLTPFEALAGRGFPVVASFIGPDGRPAESALPPKDVGMMLAGAIERS